METALPQEADNQVPVTVLLAGETWAAVVPEQGQATWLRIAVEIEWAIAASLAVAADLERSVAAEVASAAVARGPAVLAAPPAWVVVVAADEVGVVGAADDRR